MIRTPLTCTFTLAAPVVGAPTAGAAGGAAPFVGRLHDAGESVGSVTGERPAADVVRELVAGAEQALRDARDLLV